MLQSANAGSNIYRSSPVSNNGAIAFVQKVNKDTSTQQRIDTLRPRDWGGFFAIAAELGYDLDLETFHNGCLSDQISHFCPALVRFAGPLFLYKM